VEYLDKCKIYIKPFREEKKFKKRKCYDEQFKFEIARIEVKCIITKLPFKKKGKKRVSNISALLEKTNVLN